MSEHTFEALIKRIGALKTAICDSDGGVQMPTNLSPGTFVLAVVAGPDAGREYRLATDRPTWVGRSPQTPEGHNHIVVSGCSWRLEVRLEPELVIGWRVWSNFGHRLNGVAVPARQWLPMRIGDRVSGVGGEFALDGEYEIELRAGGHSDS